MMIISISGEEELVRPENGRLEKIWLVNMTEVNIIETSRMKNEFFKEGDWSFRAESGKMREVSWGEMEDGQISEAFRVSPAWF